MAVTLREFLLGGPGHRAYVYQSDVFCIECGKARIRDLWSNGKLAGMSPEDTTSEDCPSPVFFPESDYAVYCGDCGEFLYGDDADEKSSTEASNPGE